MEFTETNDINIIKSLLKDNDININIQNQLGITALMNASMIGNTEIVKFLIDSGADIESTNIYNETPILFPIAYRHTEVVQLLLEAGASLNVKDQNGNTPLNLAETNTPGYDTVEDIIELVKKYSETG